MCLLDKGKQEYPVEIHVHISNSSNNCFLNVSTTVIDIRQSLGKSSNYCVVYLIQVIMCLLDYSTL